MAHEQFGCVYGGESLLLPNSGATSVSHVQTMMRSRAANMKCDCDPIHCCGIVRNRSWTIWIWVCFQHFAKSGGECVHDVAPL